VANEELAVSCRSVSDLGEDADGCDFWGKAVRSTSRMVPEVSRGVDGVGMLARGESDGHMPGQPANLRCWAKKKVTELLTLDQESFIDPDVVVRMHISSVSRINPHLRPVVPFEWMIWTVFCLTCCNELAGERVACS
jgi:hypothetical protein